MCLLGIIWFPIIITLRGIKTYEVFADIKGNVISVTVGWRSISTASRRFDEYDADRPFQAWAIWLAKSRVIDHYRVKGREKLVFSEPILDRLAERLASKAPEVQSARAAAMEQCINKLPTKSQRLLKLRYEDGAKAEEIATALKSSAASVRVMLHRVRNLLADCIELELRKETSC